jgi:hypothetical protein
MMVDSPGFEEIARRPSVATLVAFLLTAVSPFFRNSVNAASASLPGTEMKVNNPYKTRERMT